MLIFGVISFGQIRLESFRQNNGDVGRANFLLKTAASAWYSNFEGGGEFSNNLLTYFLTQCNRVLLEKLTGSQVVNKFPAFYGTRRFITAFISARHLSLIPSKLNPVHTLTSQILKIHLNIILPSKPGSSKWSLSLRFPHQNPACASTLTRTC